MAKMGRPTDNPKTHDTRIRMSDADIQMLEYCAKRTGLSKAEIIRKGIKTVYESLKNDEK